MSTVRREGYSRRWRTGAVRFAARRLRIVPDDYTGNVRDLKHTDASDRWRWFGETFVQEAKKSVDEQRAQLAWRAIDDAFAASFPDRKPMASRDLDAAPYTLPFNETIQAFNVRLRHLLSKVAYEHGARGAHGASEKDRPQHS
jgi:hypothetical protein